MENIPKLVLIISLGVSATAHAKSYSITEFGAIANDSNDDTLSIQSAFNALSEGDELVFPNGVYTISSSILIHNDGLTVKGNGATLVKTSPQIDSIIIKSNFIKLYNLAINGQKNDSENIGGSGIVIEGSNNNLKDLNIYNHQGHGVLFKDHSVNSCHNNILTTSILNDNNEVGVAQNHCRNNKVVNNTIERNGNEGITIDNESHMSTVSGNFIAGNCMRGGVGGIGVDKSDLSTITNNKVLNSKNNCGGIKFQNNLGFSNQNIISQNHFIENSGVEIWLYKNGIYGAGDNIITNNVLRGQYASIKDDNINANNIILSNIIKLEASSQQNSQNQISARNLQSSPVQTIMHNSIFSNILSYFTKIFS